MGSASQVSRRKRIDNEQTKPNRPNKKKESKRRLQAHKKHLRSRQAHHEWVVERHARLPGLPDGRVVDACDGNDGNATLELVAMPLIVPAGNGRKYVSTMPHR